jgi:hypothetical protein
MSDVTEMPEYEAGVRWANGNLNRLIERFTDEELITEGLRTVLWQKAAQLYPSSRDDMENDLKQTAWVAGAFRRLSETLPMGREAMAAVFDAALEIGSIVGAEISKKESFDNLKRQRKTVSEFWDRKFGDASIGDIVRVLETAHRRSLPREDRGRTLTKWEVLLQTLGSRELRALETLRSAKLVKDGKYWYYDVDGEDSSFQVMAKDTVEGGRIVQGAGEIVG